MNKAEMERRSALATNALVLCASLVLTEPHVNKQQMRLARKIIKQAKLILSRRSERKA